MRPFVDVQQLIRAGLRLPSYFADWRRYSKMPGAERLRLVDAYPCLLDRRVSTPFDSHYYYVNAWAMRRIVATRPAVHVDVGSLAVFSSLLSALLPVVFADYRPLRTTLPGLNNVAADITNLPFTTGSIASISNLHVAEHIGLGRYGDALNPNGSLRAAEELTRVLKPGGTLLFAVPVGRPRTCFNAHRIFSPTAIPGFFPGLQTIECSGVTDEGVFVEHIDPQSLENSDYACAMFILRNPTRVHAPS